MALTTYDELKTSVAAWLDRSDLTAVVPDFIALFEARARRELREWLRTTVTATSVTGDYALGATVDAVLGVAYADGAGGVYNHPLDLLTWTAYHEKLSRDATVRSPVQGVFVDRDEENNTTTLRFYPPVSASSPIDALSIYAVGYLPALSASQATNRLLTVAPDVYLFGSLAEAEPYLQHDERLPMFKAEAEQGIRALQMQTDRKAFGGVPRPKQLPVVFG